MRRFVTILSFVLCACLAISPAVSSGGLSKAEAATGETENLTISLEYGQTEARSMLASINEWRTGNDAWYWNDTDTQQIKVSGATPLVYDYDLEKVAMKRAAEIALNYSHTRPNGDTPWTAYSEAGYFTQGYKAENIAAGYGTAQDVYMGWREDNDKYAGQGHRRNMLDTDFKAIGIGHVYFNGIHYWVQEFSSSVQSSTKTAANDSSANANIEVLKSSIKNVTMTPSKTKLSLFVGSQADLPGATVRMSLNGYWSYRSNDFPVICTPTYKIDSSYLSRNGNKVTGLKTGSTTITLSAYGKTATVPVTISQDISKATITGVSDQTYNGSTFTPSPTVKIGDATLRKNVDYTVTYKDNTNAGTASVVISGAGSYSGEIVKKFTIRPRSIGGATVTGIGVSYAKTGKAITPEPTLKVSGTTLKNGTDFTVSYKDNVNVGTATVTIMGKGNYTGTVTRTFAITSAAAGSSGSSGTSSGDSDPSAVITMYRLYNPNSGEHFYTASAKERDSLKKSGWKYEGEGWKAPGKSSTPVYRLYSGTDHHYTTSEKEKNALVKAGWKYEGIGWYSDDSEGVPLYRQYNPNVDPSASFNNSGSHNYTTSKKENDNLVKAGWKAEGVGWYGVKK